MTPNELFSAVCAEMRALLSADVTALERYEPDGSATIVAEEQTANVSVVLRVDSSVDGESIAALVRRSGGAVRIDRDAPSSGPVGSNLRRVGLSTAMGTPIIVEGHLWGVIVAAWRDAPEAAGAEGRITQFTELVATAIANAEGRAAVRRLAGAGGRGRGRGQAPDRARPPRRHPAAARIAGARVACDGDQGAARARRRQSGAIRDRGGTRGRARGPPGDLAGNPPGDLRRRRPRGRAEGPRAPIRRAGRARR